MPIITEAVTMIFIAIGVIGCILALKWKGKNMKPRLSDEEMEKFLNKGRDNND